MISTDTQPGIPRTNPSAESWSTVGRKPRTEKIRQRIVPGYRRSVNLASICSRSALQMPSCFPQPASVPPLGYVPHFFTHQEITAFFGACDKLQSHGTAQARHLVLPVFFRLLYCCGLRTGEARTLRVEQVDLEAGHIDIMRSKGCRSRRLPVPADVLGLLRRYAARVSVIYPGRIYFFPTTRSDCYRRRQRSSSIQPHLEGGGPGSGMRQPTACV